MNATYDNEDRPWEEYLRSALDKLVEERTKAKIAEALSVSPKTVQRWCNGRSEPTKRHQSAVKHILGSLSQRDTTRTSIIRVVR